MKANLAYWLQKIERCHPQTMDLGLTRISSVAARLNLLKFDCPIITVAGTNGKGTSVALLETILTTAGLRVASYTSPHLVHYSERFRIACQEIDEQTLVCALQTIDKARADTSLTYFEYSVLAALWIFKRQKLDAIILEVGLGGELDGVNIVDANYALITTIAFDHMQYLGETLSEIGKAKAGILRHNQQAVYGDKQPVASVLNHAHELGTKLAVCERDYQYHLFEKYWQFNSKTHHFTDLPYPNIPIQNAAAVIQLLMMAETELAVTDKDIKQGLQTTQVLGRMTQIKEPLLQIFDIAHNPHAIAYLAKWLDSQPCTGRTFAVFSMLEDKDIDASIAAISAQIDSWFLMSPDVPRATTTHHLAQCLTKQGIKSWQQATSPRNAYLQALAEAQTNDRVVVFGSCYGVAAVLGELKLMQKQEII